MKDFFKMPSAARFLQGFINNLNNHIVRSAYHGTAEFQHNNENLVITLNCNRRNFRQVVQNPVPNDHIEVSGMQNFLQLLVPQDFELDFKDAAKIEFFLKKYKLDPLLGKYIRGLGLMQSDEKVRIINHDYEVMKKFGNRIR